MLGRRGSNLSSSPSPQNEREKDARPRSNSDRTLTNDFHEPTRAQIKRATRTRLIWALLSSLLLLISLAFIVLVEIGSIRASNRILTSIYFIRLDLSNIVPTSVPNSVLINSIARTLGLHDFYTVGLWNYCEGYDGEGFTDCSMPKALYWFDPVSILQNQLLAGASIALPSEVGEILDLIRTVSHWMFVLFLIGAILAFIMIFIVPLAVYSRWASLPIVLLTFFTALFTTVAAVLATVMFIIMQDAITSVTELNIGANIGIQMFTFMWIAAAAAILAWLIQLSLCCCCASRRDVRTGRKRGSKKAWRM